jgi:[ribosomal protein S5]-alanine N-acetyltransferase
MTDLENSFIILATDRLILQRMQPSAIAPLVELWSDPITTRYLGGPRDRAWLQMEFDKSAQAPYSEQFDLWPVLEKATGFFIGHSGLLEKDIEGVPELELNYIFKPSAWGNGYATEIGRALIQYAFGPLKLKRLIALIEPQNAASERVAMRIGMRCEKEVVRPGGALRKVYAIETKGK